MRAAERVGWCEAIDAEDLQARLRERGERGRAHDSGADDDDVPHGEQSQGSQTRRRLRAQIHPAIGASTRDCF